MIRLWLQLSSDDGTVEGYFTNNGVLYLCANNGVTILAREARGTVLCAFICHARGIMMTALDGQDPGLRLQAIVSGMTVRIGLNSYRIELSKRLAYPSRHLLFAAGISICIAIGIVTLSCVFLNSASTLPAAAGELLQGVSDEQHFQASRLDQLIARDGSNQPIDRDTHKMDTDTEATISRKAYSQYEEARALIDEGKYRKALQALKRAKDIASELPVVPSYARHIDETIDRAQRMIDDEQRRLVNVVRERIASMRNAVPNKALAMVAEARRELGVVPEGVQKEALRKELEQVHRLHLSEILARARTLERLEGCRSARPAYEQVMEEYGAVDAILAQKINEALKRCEGGGRS